MRSVSFVDSLKLEVSDSLFSEALLLADVDNDGDNELIVGQINGELSIFKGSGNKPWRSCSHLGMIACVAVGDLWNQGENLLVCITAEGWCHLFNVVCDAAEEKLEPISSQHLPPNCRIVVIADVDGDGQFELVTGHADRVVHVYRLEAHSCQQGDSQVQSTKDLVSGDVKPEKTGSNRNRPIEEDVLKQCAKGQETESLHKLASTDDKHRKQDTKVSDGSDKDPGNTETGGFPQSLVSIKDWTLSSQIGSIVVFDVGVTRHLLASQPGGTYSILMSSELSHQDEASTLKSDKHSFSPSSSSIFNHLPVLGGRNQGLPTMLMCLISRDRNKLLSSMHSMASQMNLALSTPDGNLMFINGSKLHWSHHVDHGHYNLFCLSKLDITGNGSEEIALCALDGSTYIIDGQKNVVQFKFGENVMAFCAGHYAYTPGKNLPSLVYATFSNYLVMYWDTHLSSMLPKNLRVKMKSKAFANKDIEGVLTHSSEYGSDSGPSTLYKELLYGKY